MSVIVQHRHAYEYPTTTALKVLFVAHGALTHLDFVDIVDCLVELHRLLGLQSRQTVVNDLQLRRMINDGTLPRRAPRDETCVCWPKRDIPCPHRV